MESGRLIFDSSISQQQGHMLHLGGGGGGNPIFRGERSVLRVEEGGSKRRPFFTSLDELLEEYYDEQLPEKKRRLSPEQVHLLEQSFETENKLEPDRKSELARKLGLQPRQVAVWFQNRRARWKTKQLERDFDRLRSSYDELVAEHGALLKDNDRLRSQVFSLTEKIHAQELAPAGNAGSKNSDQTAAAAAAAAAAAEEGIQEQKRQKAEDRVSTGSGGSVVDEEGPQLVDSGEESYFRESYRGGCGVGVQSEEDDGSDGGCDYYPAGAFAENQNPGGWWVWN